GAFKKQEPANQIVYIDSYDRFKGLTQLRFFSYDRPDIRIKSGNTFILPNYEKEIRHEFVNETFVREFRLWVKINPKDKLNITINKKQVALTCGGKQHKEGLTGQNIANYFKGQVPNYVAENEHSDAWVFMDRDFQADDNAEHLYRYVMHNHPERNIYFALNRESHDWQRLELEGFKLLDFGSDQHHEILKSCSKVISSNADHCVVNLLGPKMLAGRHFVFLQHGVIHNDLSAWLNQKENIDCFVTSSPLEYESIAGNGSKYKYSEKEVVLTGLPRHDYLVKNNNKPDNIILVMPTWRADIVGKSDLGGHSRSINDAFLETEFARCWVSLLGSNKFKAVLEKYNYKIVIYPHPNLIPYIEHFRVSDDIEVLMPINTRIQDVFCRSAMLLTDYTSVAFDMAVQNKPTLYYQFDEYEVLHSGRHTFSPGYFKHRRDGFGPICNTEDEVLSSLEEILKNGCALDVEIANRIDRTFPLRDGACCERTFDAIVGLDSPELPDISADRLIQQAQLMTSEDNWAAAEFWWKSLSQRDDVWLKNEWYSELLDNSCLQVLKDNTDANGNIPDNIQATVLFHVFLYVKKFLDKSDLPLRMDRNQKDNFFHLLDSIFNYIDDKTILKFSREGSWFLHKIGVLNAFKNKRPDCQYVYVDSYDRIKGLVQLRYFIRGDESEIFQVGDKYSLPVYEKLMRHDILDRDFILEKRVWLPIKSKERLIVKIDEMPTILSFGGKQFKDGVTGDSIITFFRTLIPDYKVNNDYCDTWLFMDQRYHADDNAEYLYRYVMHNYPNINIYFALDQNSQDWQRLEKEGFRLLSFDSPKHHEVVQSCSKVISSQVENYVVNLLGPKMLYGRHFVYLQSGVSINDVSSLLNAKDNIDRFITATPQEYRSITGDKSKYKYSSKEVVLTGLPRFDYLLGSEYVTDNILLVIPSLYDVNDDSFNTNSLKKWNELLSSEQFISMLNVYGYKAKIYIRNSSYVLDTLHGYSDCIEIVTPLDIGYRDVLRTSRLLLTDHSSATFDMAIQNKCTVYYHENYDECISYSVGDVRKGYFNYFDDGFGPVCNNAGEVILQMSMLFENGCSANDKIQSVIADTFIYRDGKCCERVCNAIMELDSDRIPDVSIDSMIFQLTKITDSSDWKMAAKWWNSISLEPRCWETASFYTELLEHSCLYLLKHAGYRDLHVSVELQNAILKHLFHYLKRFIDNHTELDYLTETEVNKCWELITAIVQRIDDSVIMKFSQPGFWFLHKVGILGTMKKSSLPSQIVYIESIDRIKNLVQLRYFSYDDEPLFVQVGNKYSYAQYTKDICHVFLGRYFVTEKREWHKLSPEESISVELIDTTININIGGKQFRGNVSGSTIYNYFDSLSPAYSLNNEHDDIWVFMDSEMRAGNNAEYLYRHVKEKLSGKSIFFVLNQESPDWVRLEDEGFNLLAFGCNKHKDILKMCSKVISSQAESYVTNFLGPKMLLGKHFIYLQNGVNQNKLAAALNKKDTIDCFITSTPSEYQHIINGNSLYKYSEKEIVLTGMPRFDALSAEEDYKENMILIMPSLSGKKYSDAKLDIKWEAVFSSQKFNNLIEQHNYRAVFYSHS
ncbi:TPA: CDP-glycerol glycerophosphotransferase family protein, partial [Kluyvera georgiana]